MQYSFNKTMDCSFDKAITRVMEELKKEGFGVLTEIDVQKTLKKMLQSIRLPQCSRLIVLSWGS